MKALSREKKRYLVVGALLIVLVVVVATQMLPSLSGNTAQAAAKRAITSVIDGDPQHLANVAKIARAKMRKIYSGDDARDPFEPLARAATRTSSPEPNKPAAEPQKLALPHMSLYGIVWDPENPVAMIDGVDVRVGDRIKGARVTEIGINRVVFEYRSERFELTVD